MGLVHVDHFDVRGPTFPSSCDIAQDFQSLCHGIGCTLCYYRNDEFFFKLGTGSAFCQAVLSELGHPWQCWGHLPFVAAAHVAEGRCAMLGEWL